MRETIKDGNGRTVGYKLHTGSQVIVQDASGATIGRYDGNTKKTIDSQGKVRYSGDQTSALFGG
jgi:hypothetical protein